MTSLREIVSWVQSASEDELSMKTICVRAPWSADAKAQVFAVDNDGQLPPDALTEEMSYFLEAPLAKEVLEVRDRPMSTEDACRLLIHYAENDAYPEWVYI